MKQPSFPPRLSESSTDERLADALEVARSYDPSAARVRGALSRFDAQRAAGTSASSTPSVAGRSATAALKVGTLAAIAIALAGGWTVIRSEAEPASTNARASTNVPASTNAPASTNVAPAQQQNEPSTTAPFEATTVRVDDLPTAIATTTALPPKAAARTAGSVSFDDELALVESARTALAKGDASGCLARLDEYDRRVQKGTFEREVAVMRIEALIARGDTARARSLGEAFLAESPNSPYANRIRTLLARIQPTSKP